MLIRLEMFETKNRISGEKFLNPEILKSQMTRNPRL